MKRFLIMSVIMSLCVTFGMRAESSPLASSCEYHSSWVSEIGFVFPTKPVTLKDYFTANNVNSVPLTSGLGYGAQFGRHLLMGGGPTGGSTIGAIVNTNVFYSSTISTTQIYQISAYIVARAYITDSWRDGFFAELGAGPEVSAASFNGSNFAYQGNMSTRVGVGYNYQVNGELSVGATLIVAPSVISNSVLDGSRVVVNMLW